MRHTKIQWIPWPHYDVETVESYLQDMAAQGWHLKKDSITFGFACFHRGEPKTVKYRADAAQHSTSLWAENQGAPSFEEIALGEALSWEYVAVWGDFFVYRCDNPHAPELHTDPAVQALTLNAVKKKQRSSLVTCLLWLVVYPALVLRQGLLLTALSIGSWVMALVVALALSLAAGEVAKAFHLRALQRKLLRDGTWNRKREWRRNRKWYCAGSAVWVAISFTVVCTTVAGWSKDLFYEDYVPLDAYTQPLPFAVMRDLADGAYKVTLRDLDRGIHTIQEDTDLLAPRMIAYNEHAAITRRDGTVLNGGWYVDYYTMASPFLAQVLEKELYRRGSRDAQFTPLELPALPVDMARGYVDGLHFSTVLMRHGKHVLRLRFFQTSDNYTMPLEEWAGIAAQKLAQGE